LLPQLGGNDSCTHCGSTLDRVNVCVLGGWTVLTMCPSCDAPRCPAPHFGLEDTPCREILVDGECLYHGAPPSLDTLL
jgi:hypothetical protein